MIKEDHKQIVFEPNFVISELAKKFKVRYIEDFIPDEKVLFIATKED